MRKLRFSAFLILVIHQQAIAAPFCVTTQGVPPDCIYEDTTSCRSRATQLKGVCTVNTNEITSAYGTEKFCMVDSTRVPQCIYTDRSSCEGAMNAGSVCVNNNFRNINEIQQDPFENDPNRNY